jgi:hypothetical protein
VEFDEPDGEHDLVSAPLLFQCLYNDGPRVKCLARQQRPEIGRVGCHNDAVAGQRARKNDVIANAEETDVDRVNGVRISSLSQPGDLVRRQALVD